MKLTLTFITLVCILHTSISQKRVAIIGGGMAGVAAAYYINKYDPNAQITLFEKENALGGNAQSVKIQNFGKDVMVDLGPQYFTKGPWNDYISFLDQTIGMNNIQTESMPGTLIINKPKEQKNILITPLKANFRGEKLANLLKIKRFNTEAYNVYKNPIKWRTTRIEDWVNTLNFDDTYKSEVIYPFLAAALGTTTLDIRNASTYEIVSLFAFRKPKISNEFQIMTEGMGTLIQSIAKKHLESQIDIKLNSPVYSLKQTENRYEINYTENGKNKVQEFDFIISAVHGDIAAKIIAEEEQLTDVYKILKKLTYFESTIALHRDSKFVSTDKPAFLNIFTSNTNEILSSTMNLEMISPRLKGLYKSWVDASDLDSLKKSDKLLHLVTFYHPLITVDFVKHLEDLNKEMEMYSNLIFIGGWSEGLETQNSAIISAQKALESYKKFKGK